MLAPTDLPFAPPAGIITVMHLPLPPSVNRIWQRNKAGKRAVSLSREYAAWQRHADMHVIATCQMRGVKRIDGKFTAEIVIDRTSGDLDNRIKAVLDWAESRALIANDKHAEDIRVRWGTDGEAPVGCRLTLRELGA